MCMRIHETSESDLRSLQPSGSKNSKFDLDSRTHTPNCVELFILEHLSNLCSNYVKQMFDSGSIYGSLYICWMMLKLRSNSTGAML